MSTALPALLSAATAAAVFTDWLSRPSHALAAGSAQVSLVWQVPEDGQCSTQSEIEARIARITPRRFVPESASHSHTIRAEIVREPDQAFTARVVLYDSEENPLGTRALERRAPTCRTLDVSLGVIIATLLDRIDLEHAPEPSTADDEHLALGWYASGTFATLSRPSFGTGVELSLPLPVPVVIDASTSLPAELVDSQRRGARLWSFLGGLHVCPRVLGDTARLYLCIGGYAGGLYASSVGLGEDRSALRTLLGADLEPKLLVKLWPGVFLRASVAAVWMPVRPRIHWQIEDHGERSASAAPLFGMLRLGIIGTAPGWP